MTTAMIRTRMLAVAVVAGGVLAASPSGRAAALETRTYGMEPSPVVVQGEARQSFRFDLDAGEHGRDALRLFNKTDRDMILRIYVVDATRNPKGEISVGFGGASRAAQWLDLARDRVAIPPNGSARIRFRVEPPGEVPPSGESLAAIAVEPFISERTRPASVIERLATVVYVRSSGTDGGGAEASIILLVLAALAGGWSARHRWKAREPGAG